MGGEGAKMFTSTVEDGTQKATPKDGYDKNPMQNTLSSRQLTYVVGDDSYIFPGDVVLAVTLRTGSSNPPHPFIR